MFGRINTSTKLAKHENTSLPNLIKELEADLAQTSSTNDKTLSKLQKKTDDIEMHREFETASHAVIKALDPVAREYFQTVIFQ